MSAPGRRPRSHSSVKAPASSWSPPATSAVGSSAASSSDRVAERPSRAPSWSSTTVTAGGSSRASYASSAPAGRSRVERDGRPRSRADAAVAEVEQVADRVAHAGAVIGQDRAGAGRLPSGPRSSQSISTIGVCAASSSAGVAGRPRPPATAAGRRRGAARSGGRGWRRAPARARSWPAAASSPAPAGRSRRRARAAPAAGRRRRRRRSRPSASACAAATARSGSGW